MALTKEDLQAIKSIVDDSVGRVETRIDGLEKEVNCIKVDILENNVIKRLSQIEACFLDASNRYIKNSDLFEEKIALVDKTAEVVEQHSEQIQELQAKMA